MALVQVSVPVPVNLEVNHLKDEPQSFKSQLVDISFRNLTYEVTVQNPKADGPKTVKRTVLNNISGICPGGQITAILGASGAGKTSLLNIMAKRIDHGGSVNLQGELSANGKPYDSTRYASFASYVMQNDILFETFTPREAFQFVANLKYKDHALKTQRVDEAIRSLKLQRCQHTMIGGTYNKGISGGEKKRTSIGYELVTDPKCIMLDEPTSGLDSFTAFSIINLLRCICKEHNKTIIFTIHQPSGDIYELFDRIMLLVEGQLIYQGPKNQIVQYFSDIGFQCPLYSNPMDYLMSIMHSESVDNVKNYPTYFESYKRLQKPVIDEEFKGLRTQEIIMKDVQTSLGYQLSQICHRAFVNVKRDKMLVRGRILQGMFMGLIVGGIFFGSASNLSNSQSIAGVLFFLCINHFMSSLGPVLIQFPAERAVFLREENSKLYTSFAYFLGKSTIEIPLLLLVPIIQQLITYWMVKLNDYSADIVIIHFLVYCLLSLAGNSMGLMGGCIFTDVKVASGILPMLVMPMMLFSGFFQNQGNYMKWISWFQYLSPIKYSFEAAMRNNYQHENVKPDPIELMNFDIGLWEAVYALIGFIVAYRIVAFLFLILLKKKLQ